MAESQGWALVLGSSSGFGAAIAAELGAAGYDLAGVHLDRKSTVALADAVADRVRALGRRAEMFNVNAADPERRAQVLDRCAGLGGPVRVLVHSLAFGTLKPLVSPDGDQVTQAQLEMTLDVMASSLVYWTQDLVRRRLLGPGGRVFAMTSEGSTVAWPSYGPVSAAKAALESYCRQLAMELAPLGIAVNAVRAGVTDTPALRKIPGHEQMLEAGLKRNPHHRLTTPEDVARAVALLCRPEAAWITGNTLGVDGGEHVAG